MFDTQLSAIHCIHADPTKAVQSDSDRFLTSLSCAPHATIRMLPAMREAWKRRESLFSEEFRTRHSIGSAVSLVRFYLSEGRLTDAERTLLEAQSIGLESPALTSARLQLDCRRAPEMVPASLSELSAMGRIGLDDPELLLELARASLGRGHKPGCRDFLKRVADCHTADDSVRIDAAELWWEIGNEGESASILRALERSAPGEVRVLNLRASVQHRNGDFHGAQETLVRALSITPLFRPSLLNDLALRVDYTGDPVDFDRLLSYIQSTPGDTHFALLAASGASLRREWDWIDRIERTVAEDFPSEEDVLRVALRRLESNTIAGGPSRIRPESASDALVEVLNRSLPTHRALVLEVTALALQFGAFEALDRISKHPSVAASDLDSTIQCVRAALRGDSESVSRKLLSVIKPTETDPILLRLWMTMLLLRTSEYTTAAAIAQSLLSTRSVRLLEYNNILYALLMADCTDEAARIWQGLCARPAWMNLVKSSVFVAATHGLLRMRSGDLDGGRDEYDRARALARDSTLARMVSQKRDLEFGRVAGRFGRATEGRSALFEVLNGPHQGFNLEARTLLRRTSS